MKQVITYYFYLTLQWSTSTEAFTVDQTTSTIAENVITDSAKHRINVRHKIEDDTDDRSNSATSLSYCLILIAIIHVLATCQNIPLDWCNQARSCTLYFMSACGTDFLINGRSSDRWGEIIAFHSSWYRMETSVINFGKIVETLTFPCSFFYLYGYMSNLINITTISRITDINLKISQNNGFSMDRLFDYMWYTLVVNTIISIIVTRM